MYTICTQAHTHTHTHTHMYAHTQTHTCTHTCDIEGWSPRSVKGGPITTHCQKHELHILSQLTHRPHELALSQAQLK